MLTQLKQLIFARVFRAVFALSALAFAFAAGAALPSGAAEFRMNSAASALDSAPILVAQSSTPVPADLPKDRERDFIQCDERQEILTHRTPFYNRTANTRSEILDVVCALNIRNAATGEEHGGCWIHAHLYTPRDIFKRFNIHKDKSPDCREIFGNPVNFPRGGGPLDDTVYYYNCEGAGGTDAPHRRGCECPRERPIFENDRCVADEAKTPDELPDLPRERAREYLECLENFQIMVSRSPYYDVAQQQNKTYLDVACRIRFTDAPTGKNYPGCWIHSHRNTEGYKPFDSEGIFKRVTPHCRHVFGHPIRFPPPRGRGAAYMANCEGIGGFPSRDWRSCECPEETPHLQDNICMTGAERTRAVMPDLPPDRAQEVADCEEHHEVRIARNDWRFQKNKSVRTLDVACWIKFRDARNGNEFNGCWINSADYSRYQKPIEGIDKERNPDCRSVFGNPVKFPTGGGSDAVYAAWCDRIGKVASRDQQSCECPRERPHIRTESADPAGRCASAQENEAADACLANGWNISESRGGFFCDFPVARANREGKTHDKCALYGPLDARARREYPSCAEVDVFSARADSAPFVYDCGSEQRYQDGECACPAGRPNLRDKRCLSDEDLAWAFTRARAPRSVPDEFVRDYLNCVEKRQVIVDNPENISHLACGVNFMDARTGKAFGGCWIYSGRGRETAPFTARKIEKNVTPNCRDIFGNPPEFPAGEDLFAVNCDAAGKVATWDRRNCVCPPESPRPRTDGADGAERCVNAEEDKMADACADNDWSISESGGGYFCDIPVARANRDGATTTYGRCRLYGAADGGGGAPSCAEVDVFSARADSAPFAYDCGSQKRYQNGECACPPGRPHFREEEGKCLSDHEVETATARSAGTVSDAVSDERVPDYLSCQRNNHPISDVKVSFAEGRGRRDVVEFACRIKFRDAASGRTYAGCWLTKARSGAYLGYRGSDPDCRDFFGNPARFPPNARPGAVYAVGCEKTNRTASPDGLECLCPPERPHYIRATGRHLCVNQDAGPLLELCQNNQSGEIRRDGDGESAALTCAIEWK